MLVIAWIVYFMVWGVSFLMLRKPNNYIVAILAALSLVDVIYLIMHDGITLLLVVLATVFAIGGVARSLAIQMHNVNEKEVCHD